MDIFIHIYELSTDEIPKNITSAINIILDRYGEGFTDSHDYNKQAFLNIYGEPKNKWFFIKTLDDVLDVFLNELSIRSHLKPIFPNENGNTKYLSPYTKENCIEFLLMKKRNVYSTNDFDLDRIIKNVSHNKFPMTVEILEDLDWIEDFKSSYSFVFSLFKKDHFNKGFSKDFIVWFNSYFWNENFGQFGFRSEKKMFQKIYSIFEKNAEVTLSITSNHLNVKEADKVFIRGGNMLTTFGQVYLVSLHPLNTLNKERIIFE